MQITPVSNALGANVSDVALDELTDDETERVLVVVTNMGGRLPDADEPEEMLRAFRLILDKSE